MDALRVVACVKPVPEDGAGAAVDPATGAPDRRGRLVLDDADAVGVEVGLRLVEAAGGGSVTVVALAPATGHAAVRTALAMGADRAVVITDDAFAGSDALGSAKALAAAIRLAPPDLVVAGTESTDASAGVLPVQLAELLGLAAATFVRDVRIDAGELRARRVTATGWDDVVSPLPCLVTVAAAGVTPRYPSVKGIMGARSKPFEVLDAAALGLPPGAVGWAGARQEIVSVTPVDARTAAEVVEDDGSAHERIVAFLQQLGAV